MKRGMCGGGVKSTQHVYILEVSSSVWCIVGVFASRSLAEEYAKSKGWQSSHVMISAWEVTK